MTAPTLPKTDLSYYIETRFFDERPHIRDRRIPVALLAYQHQANHWTVAETAYNFSLSEAAVVSALLYYYENQALIEAQEAVEVKLFHEQA